MSDNRDAVTELVAGLGRFRRLGFHVGFLLGVLWVAVSAATGNPAYMASPREIQLALWIAVPVILGVCGEDLGVRFFLRRRRRVDRSADGVRLAANGRVVVVVEA